MVGIMITSYEHVGQSWQPKQRSLFDMCGAKQIATRATFAFGTCARHI